MLDPTPYHITCMMIAPHILGLEVSGNPANALNPIIGVVFLIVIHLNMIMIVLISCIACRSNPWPSANVVNIFTFLHFYIFTFLHFYIFTF